MELFNVGPLELIIILALMFIILGPKDMVKTAQRIGQWVRGITTSPMWREVWGISQDIRELPKKLMEDTGLEEALADMKQTTQEVADEFNATVNEAKEAARVPEIEHVRIGLDQPVAPPANSVPATVGIPVLPASIDAAEALPASEELTAAEQAAAVDAAEAVPAAARKPRRKKQAAETAGEVLDAQDAPAEPVKKTRRKKQAVLENPAVEQVVIEEPGEPTAPLPETRQQPPEAADSPVSIVLPVAMDLPVTESIADASEAPKVRKPRRKKLEIVESTLDAPAVQSVEPSLDQPSAGVLAAAVEEPTPTLLETAAIDQPPEVKKPRRRKPAESTPTDTVETSVVPAAPRRSTRLRKAAVETPVIESFSQAVTPPSNGQLAGDHQEKESTAPASRKRRAPRTASPAPDAPGNGAEPAAAAAGETATVSPTNHVSSANGDNGNKPARSRKKRQPEQAPAEQARTELAPRAEAQPADAEPVERPDRDAN